MTGAAASPSLVSVRLAPLPLVLFLSTLVACGAPPPPAHPKRRALPARARFEAADGLQEAQNDALLQKARGEPGQGKLCAGKVYTAVKPVTVYRVWNSAKAYTQLGTWWSLARPPGSVEKYSAENVICKVWPDGTRSELNSVSECHLKVGAQVVVGPGQSASCANDVTLPASAINQVFIPNETRDPANQKVYVECSTPGAAWP